MAERSELIMLPREIGIALVVAEDEAEEGEIVVEGEMEVEGEEDETAAEEEVEEDLHFRALEVRTKALSPAPLGRKRHSMTNYKLYICFHYHTYCSFKVIVFYYYYYYF
jgi:hypothetical protein